LHLSWRRLLIPLRLVVSTALLAYLIWRAEPARVWQSWQAIDLRLFGLALLLQFAGVALSAAKWGLLLRARGQAQPYSWLLRAYLVGQFASNFLPTSIGGDAVRAAQLSRRIGSLSQASASIFIERLTGFLALSLIANIALVLTYISSAGLQIASAPQLYLLTAGVAMAAIVAMIVSFSAPRLQQRLGARLLPEVINQPMQRVAQAVSDTVPQGRALASVLGMSLLYQSLLIVTHIICGLALSIQAPILLYALMVPITDILGLAPIFLNNLGAREMVFTLYLVQVGVGPATAIALAFLVFTVRLIVSILGGLITLFGGIELTLTQTAPER
jgi:glycosyltransferase 2 family protein